MVSAGISSLEMKEFTVGGSHIQRLSKPKMALENREFQQVLFEVK